jgi:hypothetical protein
MVGTIGMDWPDEISEPMSWLELRVPERWWSDAEAKGEGHILVEARAHFRRPGPAGHEELVRALEFVSNLRGLDSFPRIRRDRQRVIDERFRDALLRRSLLSAGEYDGAELEAAIAAGYQQAIPGCIASVDPRATKGPFGLPIGSPSRLATTR